MRDVSHSRSLGGSHSPREKEEPSKYYGKKPLRCYRCGEARHIKRYRRAIRLKKLLKKKKNGESF